VVDEPGDRRIDTRELLAGRNARSALGDDSLGLLVAGLRAALRAAGANEVADVESFGFLDRRTGDASKDFPADLRYELIQFRGSHFRSLAYFCSIWVIFCTRAACLPPANGVVSQTRKTSSPCVPESRRPPSVRTLESLCSLLFRAVAL